MIKSFNESNIWHRLSFSTTWNIVLKKYFIFVNFVYQTRELNKNVQLHASDKRNQVSVKWAEVLLPQILESKNAKWQETEAE